MPLNWVTCLICYLSMFYDIVFYFEHCTQISIYLSFAFTNNHCAPLATFYRSYQFYILIGPSLVLWRKLCFQAVFQPLICLAKILILSITITFFVCLKELSTWLFWLISSISRVNQVVTLFWKQITFLYMALTSVIRCWWMMIIREKLTENNSSCCHSWAIWILS